MISEIIHAKNWCNYRVLDSIPLAAACLFVRSKIKRHPRAPGNVDKLQLNSTRDPRSVQNLHILFIFLNLISLHIVVTMTGIKFTKSCPERVKKALESSWARPNAVLFPVRVLQRCDLSSVNLVQIPGGSSEEEGGPKPQFFILKEYRKVRSCSLVCLYDTFYFLNVSCFRRIV